MRKILLSILLILFAANAEAAIYRYQDTVQDRLGNAVKGATVEVYVTGTTTGATLYTDSTGLVLSSNPTLTDTNGIYYFYADAGTYDLIISKAGMTTQTRPEIYVGVGEIDAGDLAALQASIDAKADDPTTTTGDIIFRNAAGSLERFKCDPGLVPTWNLVGLTCISPSGEESGVASVFGRTGAVSAQAGDYAAYYLTNAFAGSGNIVTVGTIGTGVWNGTPLSDTYIASSGIWNAKANSASPSFTGTVSMPSPFVLGSTSVTATGTHMNYINTLTENVQTSLNNKITNATTNGGLTRAGSAGSYTLGITACTNDGEMRSWSAANGWGNCTNPATGATFTFDQLRNGTNTLGTNMLCGIGCNIGTTGTGTIAATSLTGTPALPNGTTATTQSQGNNSTRLATTAYVDSGLSGKAATNQTMNIGTTSVAINRGSGALVLTGITSIDGTATNLSGTPALPNGTAGTTQVQADNSTKLATTAYVDAGLGTKQATLTNPVTGPASPTLNYMPKWSGTGQGLIDGLLMGTMTDTKWCQYTTAGGIHCDQDEPVGTGTGDFLADGTVPMTGTFTAAASTAGIASINIPAGDIPGAPADGDIWFTTAGLFYQAGVSTIGPLGTGEGGSMTYPGAGIAVSPGVGGPWSTPITGTNCLAGFNGSSTAGCYSSFDLDMSANKFRLSNSAGYLPDNLSGSFGVDTTTMQQKISNGSSNYSYFPVVATAAAPNNYCTTNGTTVSCNSAGGGGSYTLPALTASVLGGVKGTGASLSCGGTDKVTGFGGDGAMQCGPDNTVPGGSYGTVQEEGSALTQRTVVNFIGSTLTCADNAGQTRTDCTIAALSNATPVTPAQGGTGVANGSNNAVTFTGNYSLGLTLSGVTALTLPASGTVATLAGNEQFSNKTFGSGMTWPTFNQNTSGTAANLSGTPTVPNGTAAATQTQGDNSTKLATTAYVDAGLGSKAPTAGPTFTGTVSGLISGTTNNCVKIGAGGTLVDNGAVCGGGEGGMVYPAAGVAVSTGSAWGTSLATPFTPANGGTGVANGANNTITFTGNYTLGLTLSNNTALTLPTTGTISTLAGTETLTNKRITSRISTEASNATPAPNADAVDQHNITALAVAAAFGAPTGTPVDGQKLIIRIKDNGTARGLSWNAIYRGSSDITLPTTTTLSATMYLGFIYNAADTRWDLIALSNGF